MRNSRKLADDHTILDDSKGDTVISFVPHTMVFAVKTAQT